MRLTRALLWAAGAFAAVAAMLLLACPGWAHFQAIVPGRDVVAATDRDRTAALHLFFGHPMEGTLMQMARPKRFGVCIAGDAPVDLLGTLKEKRVGDQQTWTASYRVRLPGDHVFFVEPAPYWEPAEGKFIVHYTKVVVNAFGEEDGWDHELGLPTEIIPLVRPYGLWAGNSFRGIVKRDGKPVPFAEIEVEYYNVPGSKPVAAPTDAHVTQVIKADANGVFSYAMPKAGWWAFAALSEADYKLKAPDGKPRPVELGALIWVKTYEMK
jgi:cobalt/nickel transport protein